MSMIANLRHLSGAKLQMLLKQPHALAPYLFPENSSEVSSQDDAPPIDLDKSWHGIHFVLTGSPDSTDGPLGQAILGGSETDFDSGYGPTRYHEPKAVADISSALAEISDEDFKRRFDPVRIKAANLYCVTGREDDLDYCMEYFRRLKEYYGTAAQQGHAMLLYLC